MSHEVPLVKTISINGYHKVTINGPYEVTIQKKLRFELVSLLIICRLEEKPVYLYQAKVHRVYQYITQECEESQSCPMLQFSLASHASGSTISNQK